MILALVPTVNASLRCRARERLLSGFLMIASDYAAVGRRRELWSRAGSRFLTVRQVDGTRTRSQRR